jgi:hypothetical protein
MPTRTVSFIREESDNLVTNLWIYHPGNVTEKLIFTNDKAASALAEGTAYKLLWIMDGVAGSELKVKFKVQGSNAEYLPLVSSSKIPRKPGTPAGQPLTYQSFINFTI